MFMGWLDGLKDMELGMCKKREKVNAVIEVLLRPRIGSVWIRSGLANLRLRKLGWKLVFPLLEMINSSYVLHTWEREFRLTRTSLELPRC